ncbi:DUF4190 domain-containing protein [Agromyces aureus]|uniref:DUF4190 domain-containing protein n=1 Tax=Agromyces aureus TaxID=453304 RepID=A0A191WJQ5_9MICO|nr:DUF4190 domain-containing protein [Agromyces aureus]ANJ28404.1 hypothetical protein ATC03_18585 [Agromyces aureus]
MSDLPPAPVPPAQPVAPVAASEKWNVLSIVGFVLSIIGFNVVAIVLGFIGLNQVKKTGERGRGLAIAAIIIGFVSIVLGIILTIVFFSALAATGTLTDTSY